MSKPLITFLLLTWLSVLQSCKVAQLPITTAIGTVISVDGDQVLVAFEVINKEKGSQGSNWFYCPRHNYKKGDWYPNPDKDPSFSDKIEKEGSDAIH
jgi:hypothetical protein